MKKYEFFEHTADIGIKAYGKNIEEAFENSALGITNIITNTEQVEPTKQIQIKAEAENIQALLYEWLEEIIIKFDTKRLIFSKFKVEIENNKLKATCKGEEFNTEKHIVGTEVKAITYHMMNIEESKKGWEISFVPDI